jgi:hypothetical protein
VVALSSVTTKFCALRPTELNRLMAINTMCFFIIWIFRIDLSEEGALLGRLDSTQQC